ncbi:MAG: hypothetical protein JXR58_05355 [Bacteroidales bacterium]|nr:hypothetical protein [Bacteroidales bacterium]
MREITILLVVLAFALFIPKNAICQNDSKLESKTSINEETNSKPNYSKLILVEYSISKLENENLISLISSQLMKENDIFFCYIDVTGKKLFVLRNDAKEIEKTFRGTSFQMLKSEVFEEKQFLQLYTACGISDDKTNDSELPAYVKTGNSFKDDCNYAKAKEIFIKYNSDYYNKIK